MAASVYSGGLVMGEGPGLVDFVTVSTITTAADVTFTAAQILGRMILRDPNGGARADLMPTGTALDAAVSGIGGSRMKVGSGIEFVIRNTADAAETITLTTNTGMTLSGTMTIGQNANKRFLAVKTAEATFTVYSLGTSVF